MKKFLSPIIFCLSIYSIIYVGLDIYLIRSQYAMFVVGMSIITGIAAKKIEELLKK